MNIIISGTEKFQDYHTFMRAVIVAIDESLKPDDNKINLYSVGGYKLISLQQSLLTGQRDT